MRASAGIDRSSSRARRASRRPSAYFSPSPWLPSAAAVSRLMTCSTVGTTYEWQNPLSIFAATGDGFEFPRCGSASASARLWLPLPIVANPNGGVYSGSLVSHLALARVRASPRHDVAECLRDATLGQLFSYQFIRAIFLLLAFHSYRFHRRPRFQPPPDQRVDLRLLWVTNVSTNASRQLSLASRDRGSGSK